MAVTQIGITVGNNMKEYQGFTTDLEASYPTDCSAGSKMVIYDATAHVVDHYKRFDGVTWNRM